MYREAWQSTVHDQKKCRGYNVGTGNASHCTQMKQCCWGCYRIASVVSDSVRPHRQQPTRLPRPWDSPGKNTGVGCHFLLQCMKVKSESEVPQPCPTPSDPMDCRLPGSSVHGIFQARVLEWIAHCLLQMSLTNVDKKRIFILICFPKVIYINGCLASFPLYMESWGGYLEKKKRLIKNFLVPYWTHHCILILDSGWKMASG